MPGRRPSDLSGPAASAIIAPQWVVCRVGVSIDRPPVSIIKPLGLLTMKPWAMRLCRILGIANVLVGLICLAVVIRPSLLLFFGRLRVPDAPYFVLIFSATAIMECIWSLLCIRAGIHLWRLRRQGYVCSKTLFIFMIVYALILHSLNLLPGERGFKVWLSPLTAFVYLKLWWPLFYSLVGVVLLGVFLRKAELFAGPNDRLNEPGPAPSPHRPWIVTVVRVFGALNVLFALLGMAVLVLSWINPRWGSTQAPWPRAVALLADSILSLLFVTGLLASGYLLFRLDRRGVTLSNWLCFCELGYWLAWTSVPMNFAHTYGWSTSMVTVGQVITAYPILALVALNLARRHLDRHKKWEPQLMLSAYNHHP